ncbi:MAG: 50S ribosomal protein L11 [DPANN group archaeon]|nr:50S ribosomal protein L11 [DPANN group archaeon]
MSEEIIETIVDGGKASAGPPLGPALGPMGVNIKAVIDTINEKTEAFKGMKVPVLVKIDTETKEFKIEVGAPSVSELIKKELNLEKASGMAGTENVADMKIEQAIKIAKMKQESMGAKTLKSAVKTVIGTCVTMGILIEDKTPQVITKEINEGLYDQKIESGKTELSEDELKIIEGERKTFAETIKKQHADEEIKVVEILEKMKNKSASDIKHKLKEAGISKTVIDRMVPKEGSRKEAKK